MSQYVTAIRTADGDKQIDYNALANKPTAKSLGAVTVEDLDSVLSDVSPSIISSTAPENTNALWIDTANSSVLKYYDGSAWVAVGAVWK